MESCHTADGSAIIRSTGNVSVANRGYGNNSKVESIIVVINSPSIINLFYLSIVLHWLLEDSYHGSIIVRKDDEVNSGHLYWILDIIAFINKSKSIVCAKLMTQLLSEGICVNRVKTDASSDEEYPYEHNKKEIIRNLSTNVSRPIRSFVPFIDLEIPEWVWEEQDCYDFNHQ
jgi:hypothetical protein